MVIIVQLCKYTKSHWFGHLKQANFMVCKLHLNEIVLKNPQNLPQKGEGGMEGDN